MSTKSMVDPPFVSATKLHSHSKAKSEKRSTRSKKRRREEEQAQQSPVKKPRSAAGDADAGPRGAIKRNASKHMPAKVPVTAAPALASTSTLNESPLALQTTSFYLPLAPIGQQYPMKALCAEHLSPLLLTYYPPLKGVVLAYHNVRLSEGPRSGAGSRVLAYSINEYAVSFVWVTADFVVLRPRKGIWIEGCVNLQTESHLGLVCWNLFSASIGHTRLPDDWTWVATDDSESVDGQPDAGQGHFVDGRGKRISGVVAFCIRDFEMSPRTENDRGFIAIEGSLLPPDKERELDKRELEKYTQQSATRIGRRLLPSGTAKSSVRRLAL